MGDSGASQALSPILVGSVQVRNRIVSTAHTTGYSRDGKVTEALIAYHRARANGGAGLIVLEGGSVHPSFVSAGLRYHSEEAVTGLRDLADAIRPTGARVFGQLMHGGLQSAPSAIGEPAWTASPVVGVGGAVARAMTVGEIEDVAAGFVTAAEMLADAGMDGCEVHLGHGYLLAQFLSPAYNRRDDDYGGTAERRMRFAREILEGVSKLRGQGFAVGVRIGPEAVEGGLDPSHVSEIVTSLQDADLIDYVSLTLGNYAPMSDVLQVAPMTYPSGYQLSWNESIGRQARVPVVVTGRFRTIAEAERVIASGVAQLVGMTRAQLADPEVVRKTVTGAPQLVRPCIACNECVLSRYTVGPLRCAVNPDLPSGEGSDHVVPAIHKRRVLVIGGGPAGLEAARTSALRGHQVHLVEQSARLGGTAARAATAVPGLALMNDALRWLEGEVIRLGVTVDLDTEVDVAGIRASDPDVVLVATGARAKLDATQSADPGRPIPGARLPHVYDASTVLDVPIAQLGPSALILDSLGNYEALGVAEYLVTNGVDVTFVTHLGSVAASVGPGRRVLGAMTRLHASGHFDAATLSTVVEIRPESADIGDLAHLTRRTISAATVVLVVGRSPAAEMPRALDAAGIAFAAVGDALAPRDLRAAIADGHRAALAI